MDRDEDAREPRTRSRERLACEEENDDGNEPTRDRVCEVGDPGCIPEEHVEAREVGAVTDRVVAPRMPLDRSSDDAVVRIAVTLGDAASAEVVVVAVPHRLAGEPSRRREAE